MYVYVYMCVCMYIYVCLYLIDKHTGCLMVHYSFVLVLVVGMHDCCHTIYTQMPQAFILKVLYRYNIMYYYVLP